MSLCTFSLFLPPPPLFSRRHCGVYCGLEQAALLPRDEHASAGRAPHYRAHHWRGSRGADAARGKRFVGAVGRGGGGGRVLFGLPGSPKTYFCISAGEELQIKQEDIGINGWAVESRVYAEDSYHMLPSTGVLHTYIEPHNLVGGRVAVDFLVYVTDSPTHVFSAGPGCALRLGCGRGQRDQHLLRPDDQQACHARRGMLLMN